MLRRFAPTVAILLVAAATAQAQVKLELKHRENTKERYRSTTKIQQTLTINAMEIETSSEESSISTVDTGKRRDDGSLPVTRKIESLKAELHLPMDLSVSFDSQNPKQEKPDNPILAGLVATMKAVVGLSFTTVLDKQGKVSAVEGTEKLLDDADLDPMIKEQIKSRFQSEKLKRNLQQDYDVFPDILVRKGEPWERTETMDLGGNQTLTFKKKYEYLGTENVDGKPLDKIGVKAETAVLTVEPNPASPVSVAKSDLKIDSSDGTILFDREAGRVVKRQLKTHIKGDLTLEAGGNEIPSKIDLTLDSSVQLEPVAK